MGSVQSKWDRVHRGGPNGTNYSQACESRQAQAQQKLTIRIGAKIPTTSKKAQHTSNTQHRKEVTMTKHSKSTAKGSTRNYVLKKALSWGMAVVMAMGSPVEHHSAAQAYAP